MIFLFKLKQRKGNKQKRQNNNIQTQKISLQKMENNQQSIENLVEFISLTVSLNRRLQKKKVDPALLKLAFAQVDNKRKGYLDLANVYELCGQVSQDELFIVFKWLDSSKNGDVSYEDFQYALTGNSQPQESKKQQADALSAVKQCITVYLENWDYLKGSRQKLNINSQKLASIFRSICQSLRKSSLSVEDLISVFSQSKKFDSLCKEEVRFMFRSEKTINQRVFLQAFSADNEVQKSSNVPAQQYSKHEQPEYQQQQLLDDINNEYNAQRNIPKFKSQKIQQVNKFIQDRYPKSLLDRENKFSTEIKRQQVRDQVPQRSTDQKGGDIQELLTNIQKRRQQLKKGSLERKKLIEEALSRKRSNLTPTDTPQFQGNDTYEVKNFTRQASTPKAGSYSQNYVNNFVDSNKNDLGKMFSKYREERENFSNTDSKMREKKYDEEISYRAYGRTQVKSPKYAERTALNFDQPDTRSQLATTIDWRNETFRTGENNYTLDTPKFSQTAQQRFFERPSSLSKVDRISQIRQKINYLPERSGQQTPKQPRQIDFIIEKYRNYKVESGDYAKRSEEGQRTGFSSYLMNQSPSSFRGVDGNSFSQQRKTPQSYIQEQKPRQTGLVNQYRSPQGSIQKENLLKKAEEQAARKIQQIERKAKLKVLERKSAVGLKWVK